MKIINQGKYIDLNTGVDVIVTDYDIAKKKLNVKFVGCGQLATYVGDIVAQRDFIVEDETYFGLACDACDAGIRDGFEHGLIDLDEIQGLISQTINETR